MKGDIFIINTDADWQRYIAWRNQQVCEGCGKKFAERLSTETWFSEYLCNSCFVFECQQIK